MAFHRVDAGAAAAAVKREFLVWPTWVSSS